MPVRRIPKNYRNVTGIAAHSKAEGQAMFESTLERDFIALLEFDPTVETFEVQPLTIEWRNADGKIRHYTPDVLAKYDFRGRRNKVLYEVKYRSDLLKNWAELRPKLRAAVHFAHAQNWRFKIVSEVEIRTVFLDNAKFLLPFVRQGPTEEAHMDLLDASLSRLRTTTPAELLQAVFKDEWNRARLLPTFWYLVGTRQIGANLNTKLTMTSHIWSLR
jgi:hypothetical protein